MKNYRGQKGFGLILVIIAIVIIAVIAFGVKNWSGQIEQSKRTENKAATDLEAINNNLIINNQKIQDNLENQ